jgi:hypothetical protein
VKFPLQEEMAASVLVHGEQGLSSQFTQSEGGMVASLEHEYTVQLFPEQFLVTIFLNPSDALEPAILFTRNFTTARSSQTYVAYEKSLLT